MPIMKHSPLKRTQSCPCNMDEYGEHYAKCGKPHKRTSIKCHLCEEFKIRVRMKEGNVVS